MLDPWYHPSSESPPPNLPASEIKSRNYAWTQSLEKGIKLCRNNGHEGDAQTLEDIVKALKQITPK